MNKGSTSFQTVLLLSFAGFLIVGFLAFTIFRTGDAPNQDVIGNVVIWGTLPRNEVELAIDVFEEGLGPLTTVDVRYRYIPPEDFDAEFVEALAVEQGPDLFILHQGDIIKHLNKIHPVSYDSLSARKYRDNYIEGAEIFLRPEGILAVPFVVDPMVMYWNRDILSREGIVQIPETWSELKSLASKLTRQGEDGNITLSALPFGEYRNVTYAKEIISALFLQTGSSITSLDEDKFSSTLTEYRQNNEVAPEDALDFYTRFANPVNAEYSWNRALPESSVAFQSGDLAFYFAPASDVARIRQANPNLNFDIAPLPQILDDKTPATFANFYGLALTKKGANKWGAFRVAQMLASDEPLRALSAVNNLPPTTRSLLSERQTDDVRPIFYQSAVIARAWLEPDREEVDVIFRDMVEDITSGRKPVPSSLGDASARIEDTK